MLSFGPSRPPAGKGPGGGFLAPRIVVYAILALAAAWHMHRLELHRAEARRALTEEPIPAAAARETSLRNGGSAGKLRPLLLLLRREGDDSLATLAEAAQRECAKRDVGMASMLVADEGSDQLKRLFHIQKLPVMLLLDADNKELARIEHNLSPDALPALLDNLPK